MGVGLVLREERGVKGVYGGKDSVRNSMGVEVVLREVYDGELEGGA